MNTKRNAVMLLIAISSVGLGVVLLPRAFRTRPINQDLPATNSSPVLIEILKLPAPAGETGPFAIASNASTLVVVGPKTLLRSDDDGKTWRLIPKGNLKDKYVANSELEQREAREVIESENGDWLERICPAEDAVVSVTGSLFAKAMCEHHQQLLIVPIGNNRKDARIVRFGLTRKGESSDSLRGPIVFVDGAAHIASTVAGNPAFVRIEEDSGDLKILWRDRSTSAPVGTYFLPNGSGFLLLSDGRLLKTSDRGKSWAEQTGPIDGIARKVSDLVFINENVGFACGTDGRILKTDDGGITWIEKRIDGGGFLFQVIVGNENEIWVLDSTLKIWLSDDSGASWRRVDEGRLLPESAYSRAVVHRGRLWVPNGDSLLVIGAGTSRSKE